MDGNFAAKILGRLPGLRVAVLGDYCLDKYIHFDPALSEISRETRNIAYQVTRIRTFPGAAGTVCANLSALGFGGVSCFGAVGDDGEGYELRRELASINCAHDDLLVTDRLTNTYLKPVDTEMREASRYDFRTREPVSVSAQDELIDRLIAGLDGFNAVLVIDQFDSPSEGLVSEYMLSKLCALAAERPDKLFFADSRARPGDFINMTVKCNVGEASLCAGLSPTDKNLPEIGRRLVKKTGRPAFITCGERGILSVDSDGTARSPTVGVGGPIDIVGAGDSASAGLVAALCCGAPMEDAAFFANIVSSVTIRKIGVTGTASPEEIIINAAAFEGLAAERKRTRRK